MCYSTQLLVSKEALGLWEELTKAKDEWRFAIIDGALSVMTYGTTMMLVLYADNWDFLPLVCEH
jgi:hypothetical protein